MSMEQATCVYTLASQDANDHAKGKWRAPGQDRRCRDVGLAGQPSGPAAAHLAGRGGGTVGAAATYHGTHRRVMCGAIGVVDVPTGPASSARGQALAAGEAAERRLAQQPHQPMACAPALATLRQRRSRETGQAKRISQFTIGKQPGVGGDPAAMEFQRQPAPAQSLLQSCEMAKCLGRNRTNGDCRVDPRTEATKDAFRGRSSQRVRACRVARCVNPCVNRG
jgi:hypothetical protein